MLVAGFVHLRILDTNQHEWTRKKQKTGLHCARFALIRIDPSRNFSRWLLQQRKHCRSGGLLGRAAAAAAALGTQIARVDAAFDVEQARVVGTTCRDQIIGGQWLTARLQPLLQARFRVLVVHRRRGSQPWRDERAHEFAAGDPATVEMNGGDERLERVGQDRIATEASALQLSRTKVQRVAQVEFARDRRESRLAHEACAQARQLAFVGLRKFLEQKLGDDHIDQRVAEEFESFVVARPGAAVGQRAFAQSRVAETVGNAKQSVSRIRGGQIFSMLEVYEQRNVVQERNLLVVDDLKDTRTALRIELDRVWRHRLVADVLDIHIEVEFSANLLDRHIRDSWIFRQSLH